MREKAKTTEKKNKEAKRMRGMLLFDAKPEMIAQLKMDLTTEEEKGNEYGRTDISIVEAED